MYAPTGMTNDSLPSSRWHRDSRDTAASTTGTNRRADPLARLPISGPDSFEHVREKNVPRARARRAQIIRARNDFPQIYLQSWLIDTRHRFVGLNSISRIMKFVSTPRRDFLWRFLWRQHRLRFTIHLQIVLITLWHIAHDGQLSLLSISGMRVCIILHLN